MKIIIFILGLAIGIFFLQKYYPEKSSSVEIKAENPKMEEVEESGKSDVIQEIAGAIVEENLNPKPNEPKILENITLDSPRVENNKISITNKLVSFGFEKSDSRAIDTIIIHSSYNALGGNEYDVDKLIKEYKEYEVSPHYLIDRKGKIYRLVADKDIAYHAGVSQVPDGRKGVNNFSLGIEMMNNKEDKYTSEQYAMLKKLIESLKGNYKIKYVLGHNQIAPGRKTDPWNFDWGKM